MSRAIIALFVVNSALDGCVPIRVSKTCQAQIDQCLKACPEPPPNQDPNTNTFGIKDTRSQCQKNCQQICR